MKSIKLEHMSYGGIPLGQPVRVKNHYFQGLTGIVKDTGKFSCMGGAYELTGIKVQLNGVAGPVILQETQIEKIEPSVPAVHDWYFAEMEVGNPDATTEQRIREIVKEEIEKKRAAAGTVALKEILRQYRLRATKSNTVKNPRSRHQR